MGTVECDACVARSNGLYGAIGAIGRERGGRKGGREGGDRRKSTSSGGTWGSV